MDDLVKRLELLSHPIGSQASDCIEAQAARIAKLEAQNDMLRHATDKLRSALKNLNERYEPLRLAFLTAVELLNDAVSEGKKDE